MSNLADPHHHDPNHDQVSNPLGPIVDHGIMHHSMARSTFQVESGKGSMTEEDSMVKMCGYPMKESANRQIHRIRTGIEIFLIVFVFIFSFVYFSKLQTVSLVPQENCGQCYSCTPMYQLQQQTQQVSYPLRVFIKTNASTYIGQQDLTLFAKWVSCGVSENSKFSFGNQTTVHKTSNVLFPFGNPSTTWSASLMAEREQKSQSTEVSEMSYYYSYDALGPNISAIPMRDALMVDVEASISGLVHHSLNYTDKTIASLDEIPPGNASMCFRLQCGVLDYYINSFSQSSATTNEVADTTLSPYVQMQAEITMTASTVSGTCSGTIYGSPIPYFTGSNSVQQSQAFLCTSYPTHLDAMSSSFANTIMAFGVMNFFAKAAITVSAIGWREFWMTCGGGALDL